MTIYSTRFEHWNDVASYHGRVNDAFQVTMPHATEQTNKGDGRVSLPELPGKTQHVYALAYDQVKTEKKEQASELLTEKPQMTEMTQRLYNQRTLLLKNI
jgi:hypothetical protein